MRGIGLTVIRRLEQLDQLRVRLRSLVPVVRPEEGLKGRKNRPRVVLAPLRDGPLRGGPQVVDLHAKLVARLHHALAEQYVCPVRDHPEVEAGVLFSRLRELPLLNRQLLGGILAEKLVQLEATQAGSTHE